MPFLKISGVVAAFALIGLPIAVVGCLSSFDDFDSNRRAYQECLDEHPDDPSRCDELRARADEHSGEYERESQQRWGCEQQPDRCNEPRPGQR